MSLPNLFSRRKREAIGGQSDVYQYDTLPQKVRVQLVQIMDEFLSDPHGEAWEYLRDTMRKEQGVFELVPHGNGNPARWEVVQWFVIVALTDSALDVVEVCLRIIDVHFGEETREKADNAVREFNARLLEAGIGYQYESGMLVEMSSRFIHAEVIVPTLTLLAGPDFAAANSEFLDAHRKFREADYESSLVDCCKSLESVLKVICANRGWEVSPNATASALIEAVLKHGLVPEFLGGQFGALQALLQSGIPTVRNKKGGHGGGKSPHNVSRELAAYQLHQTASAIVFLVQSNQALP